MPTAPSERLVLVGDTELVEVIAQLTVASGRRATCVSGSDRPTSDEPWTEGVDWTTCSGASELAEQFEGAAAVVWVEGEVDDSATGDRDLQRVVERASEVGIERMVVVAAGEEEADFARFDAGLEAGSLEVAKLRTGSVDATAGAADAPSDQADLAAHRVGMAALRAACEPGRGGDYGPDEVQQLGNAAMLQS